MRRILGDYLQRRYCSLDPVRRGSTTRVPFKIANVPAGVSVSSLVWTAKQAPTDADALSKLTKTVTPVLSATDGQISQALGGQPVEGYFMLLAADVSAGIPDYLYHDLWAFCSDLSQRQVSIGDITVVQPVAIGLAGILVFTGAGGLVLIGFAPAVSTGPLVIVSDTFTRADNAASLGNAETGQTWVPLVGTWGIQTGRAYLPGGVGNETVVVESGVSACSVMVTAAATTPNNAGVCFNVTDANNYWGLWGGNNGLFLIKCVAGSQTVPVSDAIPVVDGDILMAVRNGSSILCYVNGVQRLTLTDAFNASATKHGLQRGGSSPSHRWDTFKVTVP